MKQTRYVGAVRSVTVDDLDQKDKELLPMVLDFATKLHRPESTVTREQLISAGLLGVAQAKAKFNPKANTLLSTLAYHHIRGRMLDVLAAERKYGARFEVTDPADMLDAQSDQSSVEERVIHASIIARVRSIIKRECTDEQKQVLSWFLAGHSRATIAAHLCVPVSTIDALIETVLDKLRTRLGVKK